MRAHEKKNLDYYSIKLGGCQVWHVRDMQLDPPENEDNLEDLFLHDFDREDD